MTGWGTRLIAVLAVMACAIVVLAGCGSSDSDTSGTSSGTPSATGADGTGEGGSAQNAKGSGDESSQSGGDSDSSGSDGSSANVDPAPLKVSGGGSTQYRVAGGDNSVQEFGEEGDESELEEAAGTLHAFLVARAEERWTAACALMAKSVKDQLNQLASRSDQLKEKGCAEILGALTPPLPAAVRNESTIVDAGSLRFEDDRAFLIYTGAEGATYAIVMEEEDGAWKVASLSPLSLS